MKKNKCFKWSSWPKYDKKNFKALKKTFQKNSLVAWGDKKGLFKSSTVGELEKNFQVLLILGIQKQ